MSCCQRYAFSTHRRNPPPACGACHDCAATRAKARRRVKVLGLAGPGKMGEDIGQIIDGHLVQARVVERLRM